MNSSVILNQKQKDFYLKNRDRLVSNQRVYDQQNRDKINNRRNEYFRIRKKSDLNFELACNLRSRTDQAFKSQNVRKTKKTFDLSGCFPSFF